MPYMPTNFYPKNCAIDLSSNEITFAADIDTHDTIHEIEIVVYDYYSKNDVIFAVRIQKATEDEKIKTGCNTKVTIWELNIVEVVENEQTISSYSYANYNALYTNRIILPLRNGEKFKFSIPVTWYVSNPDKLYTKDPDSGKEKEVTTHTILIDNIGPNKKYYWTMTAIDSSGYSIKLEDHSVWVSDGFIYDTEIIPKTGKKGDYEEHVVKIPPSENINPNIYDKKNDTYYRNQIFVHEKEGSAYGFSIDTGTGYYDKEGTAHRIGLRTGYKSSTQKDEHLGDQNNSAPERLAIFSEVIPLEDHLNDLIAYGLYDASVETNENSSNYGNILFDYKPDYYIRKADDLQFTIDIYNLKIKKIYKECYYSLNNDGSIGALIDTSNLTPGYELHNGKWYKITTSKEGERKETETDTYDYCYKKCANPDRKDSEDVGLETLHISDLYGPFTVVEYEDNGDLIPLGPVDNKYKDLSGHYLHLNRLWTSIYLYNKDGEKVDLPNTLLNNDSYKIMSNNITSFDNYFETVKNLKATITENPDADAPEDLNSIVILNGPARTFKGHFNGDLEWSYWETKLITYEDNKREVVLGEEIVDTSEKNYTKQILYTYFGFKEIQENQRYEVTLYVKDKRNIVISSSPCKINKIEMTDLGKEENGIAVKTFWNYEKSGIEVDFSQLIGVNGQLYRSGQEMDITKDNFKFKKDTRLAYIQNADYLLYDVLKSNQDYYGKYNNIQNGVVFACQALEGGFSGNIIKIGNYDVSFVSNCNNNVLSPAFKINNFILPLYGEVADNIRREVSSKGSNIMVSIFSKSNEIDYSYSYIFDGTNTEKISDEFYLVYGDIFDNQQNIYCYLDNNNFVLQVGEYYWSFSNLLGWGENGKFGNIYLYPNLGYEYIYFNTPDKIKGNLIEFIDEHNKINYKFKNDISNFIPSWYSFTDNKGNGIMNSLSVFFTNFGEGDYPTALVTNGIKLEDNSNYSYEGIVIYRECYDLADNLLETLFINKIPISKAIFYDYSVSNRYKYYYRVIPYYSYGEDLKAWSYSGSSQKVQPDYYDVSIFEACNDFNFDKIYYYNPYEKSNGRWDFMLDINADDISYTSETAVSPGSNFAKIAKTNMLYMQGSVTAKVGTIRNEVEYLRDNPIEIRKLVNFLSNPGIKMLRLKNGECLLVDTQIKSRKNQSQLVENPTDISFDWYQIEDQDFFFYEIKQ